MLTLLKTWWNLHSDLKTPSQSWTEALNEFVTSSLSHIQFILSGIQYFHECETAAKDREDDSAIVDNLTFVRSQDVGGEADYELGKDFTTTEQILSEEGLAELIAARTSVSELNHACLAIEIAKRAHVFANDTSNWAVSRGSVIANATGNDMVRLQKWQAQMKEDVLKQNMGVNNSQHNDYSTNSAGVGRMMSQLWQLGLVWVGSVRASSSFFGLFEGFGRKVF
jgi:hypothetical protein